MRASAHILSIYSISQSSFEIGPNFDIQFGFEHWFKLKLGQDFKLNCSDLNSNTAPSANTVPNLNTVRNSNIVPNSNTAPNPNTVPNSNTASNSNTAPNLRDSFNQLDISSKNSSKFKIKHRCQLNTQSMFNEFPIIHLS